MRSLRVSAFLAGRSLARSNHGIAIATTSMMLLIYISLLFLPSLIQGAIDRVNARLVDTLTSNIVITPPPDAGTFSDVDTFLAQVRAVPGVQAASGELRVGTEIAGGTGSGSWTIAAIDPGSFGQVFTTPGNLVEGRVLASTDTDQVLLGIGIAGADQTSVRGYRASLRTVHAGDQVTLTLTDGSTATTTVAGIYDNQFAQSNDTAYITLDEAAQLLPATAGRATAIYVKTTPGTDVDAVAAQLATLRGDAVIRTATDLGATVQDQVATFQLISDILKFISLLMAAITIFTITYVDLTHKRRHIGIERAIGIRPAPIVVSYVLKAWAYALAGIGTGLLLFLFVVTPIVRQHPFRFPNGPVTLATSWSELTLDLAILLVVATLAALIPATRSVQARILDAIWGGSVSLTVFPAVR